MKILVQIADLTAFNSRLLLYEKLKESLNNSDNFKISGLAEINDFVNERGLEFKEYKEFREPDNNFLQESEEISEEIKTNDTCSVQIPCEKERSSYNPTLSSDLDGLYTEIEKIFRQDDELLIRMLLELQESHIGSLFSMNFKVTYFHDKDACTHSYFKRK